jgi:hypothetical protein
MSSFTTPLELRYLDGRNWCLISEFDFASEVLERVIRIPAGCETDFASIPPLLWPVLPPTGRYGKSAVVHDFLYRKPRQATRRDADRVFLEGMEVLNVNWFLRYLLYAGVRVCGSGSYKGGL